MFVTGTGYITAVNGSVVDARWNMALETHSASFSYYFSIFLGTGWNRSANHRDISSPYYALPCHLCNPFRLTACLLSKADISIRSDKY